MALDAPLPGVGRRRPFPTGWRIQDLGLEPHRRTDRSTADGFRGNGGRNDRFSWQFPLLRFAPPNPFQTFPVIRPPPESRDETHVVLQGVASHPLEEPFPRSPVRPRPGGASVSRDRHRVAARPARHGAAPPQGSLRCRGCAPPSRAGPGRAVRKASPGRAAARPAPCPSGPRRPPGRGGRRVEGPGKPRPGTGRRPRPAARRFVSLQVVVTPARVVRACRRARLRKAGAARCGQCFRRRRRLGRVNPPVA